MPSQFVPKTGLIKAQMNYLVGRNAVPTLGRDIEHLRAQVELNPSPQYPEV
jgi:hypothetical protein